MTRATPDRGVRPKFLIPPCIATIVVCAAVVGFSRDIDLDGIYIKRNIPQYRKLFETRLDAYRRSNSLFIDRDVIFADWITGFDVLYIREAEPANIVCLYDRKKSASRELFRFDGTVTLAKTGFGGRYLLVKRLVLHNDGIPRGNGICFDLRTGRKTPLPGQYPFMNFTMAPSGNSVFIENKSGIAELDLNTGLTVEFLAREKYERIMVPDSPVMAFPSPNRAKVLVISGSGGTYRGVLISDRKSVPLNAITSPAEVFWVSNSEFVYRGGGTGNFSVALYDTSTGQTRKLLDNSLSTSIAYSQTAKVLSFLSDQVINIYRLREKQLFITGLEGDDVSFSPDGNRFVSLMNRRLFLTGLSDLMRRHGDLKQTHTELADLYESLIREGASWENEYSPTYLRRKAALYRRLAASIPGTRK